MKLYLNPQDKYNSNATQDQQSSVSFLRTKFADVVIDYAEIKLACDLVQLSSLCIWFSNCYNRSLQTNPIASRRQPFGRRWRAAAPTWCRRCRHPAPQVEPTL